MKAPQAPHITFTKAIAANIKRQREAAKLIRASSKEINAIGKIVAAATARFKGDGLSVHDWQADTSPLFYLSVSGFNSFSDDSLTDFLGALMEAGMEITNRDYPANISRDFTATRKLETGLEVRVQLMAYVNHDSKLCQRVVKSSRTVQEYEFEIVCG